MLSLHALHAGLRPYRAGRNLDVVKAEYGLKDVIKLASNENPLGPSPLAIEAIREQAHLVHLYPDAAAQFLVEDVAQFMQTPVGEIYIGNGSDEIFDLLIQGLCEPNKHRVLVSHGAFSAYELSAAAHRVEVVKAALREDFSIDLRAFSEILEQDREIRIKLVFIPNINNPTGLLIPKQELFGFLEQWAKDSRRWIVLDEAYHEYIDHSDYQSAWPLASRYPGLLVTRTMSKAYGLAGLRVGFMRASAEIVDLLHRLRKPFHLGLLTQVAARAALRDQDHVRRSVLLNKEQRAWWEQKLGDLGLGFLSSQGNFIMLDTQRDVVQVEEFFLRQGVVIRPVDNYGFKTWIRVSVGLPQENERAFVVLSEMCKALPLLTTGKLT
ncbi:MAG: histidinol-phosphate transaminase [Bdellovibrionaceae bacterium]|jgi:histidinol-phosphate aminotransferase|nr:histidinol-phosphate transaminase [Pseudobdellovibrionaceae bacterium]